ncbi:hypothetical protein MTO98_33730 [Mucilaginibacter sp. SMC90]|uniref:hypothetical protein n=1 Tax=Mucilaginibacter sp. SMC90 TaxID=2929803 RepID=UPI001FB25453|nr:hypothetical protein [Mucilaginibacter sp. SMC90]UOE49357.1 hypothetical protein MTO98_33730 [Mucilaginibacter sp. SMC90]
MTKENDQKLHESLITFLNTKFKNEDSSPVFNTIPSILSTDQFNKININDINKAVKVFVKVLNLNGGSNSDVDLYELLQVYLRQPIQRRKINDLVKDVVYKSDAK